MRAALAGALLVSSSAGPASTARRATEVTRDATGAVSISPDGARAHIDGTIDHAL